MRSSEPTPIPEPNGRPLTERLVDELALHPDGQSVMALAIALRAPYPVVEAELLDLEGLGVVVRVRVAGGTRWSLG